MLGAWVDDLVYGSTDAGWVETSVGKKITIGDCRDLTWFPCISLEESADRMSLGHSMYISNLFKKFGLERCKHISKPLAD